VRGYQPFVKEAAEPTPLRSIRARIVAKCPQTFAHPLKVGSKLRKARSLSNLLANESQLVRVR
jgi:hypothetical protein